MIQGDQGKEVTVVITTGTIVRAVFIIVFLALLWSLRDIALVVLTAIVLASAIEPVVKFLGRRRIPRLPALVLIFAAAGSLLITLSYFFIPAFLSDTGRLFNALPSFLDVGSLSGEGAAQATSFSAFEGAASSAGGVLDLFRQNLEGGGAFHSAAVFFGGILSFVLIIVLSFYLAAQERGVENFLRLVSPRESRAYVVDLWKRSQHKIGQWFQGQLLLGALTGVTTFLGLTILDVPNALFLSVLMMVFELIPVFGPILAAVPGIALAFTHGIAIADPGLSAALIVAGFYTGVQQFESHFLYPYVVRLVTGIPPVLVVLALVVGGKLAGFLGILLAVPLTAVLMEFLSDVAKEKRIFDDD